MSRSPGLPPEPAPGEPGAALPGPKITDADLRRLERQRRQELGIDTPIKPRRKREHGPDYTPPEAVFPPIQRGQSHSDYLQDLKQKFQGRGAKKIHLDGPNSPPVIVCMPIAPMPAQADVRKLTHYPREIRNAIADVSGQNITEKEHRILFALCQLLRGKFNSDISRDGRPNDTQILRRIDLMKAAHFRTRGGTATNDFNETLLKLHRRTFVFRREQSSGGKITVSETLFGLAEPAPPLPNTPHTESRLIGFILHRAWFAVRDNYFKIPSDVIWKINAAIGSYAHPDSDFKLSFKRPTAYLWQFILKAYANVNDKNKTSVWRFHWPTMLREIGVPENKLASNRIETQGLNIRQSIFMVCTSAGIISVKAQSPDEREKKISTVHVVAPGGTKPFAPPNSALGKWILGYQAPALAAPIVPAPCGAKERVCDPDKKSRCVHSGKCEACI